MKPAPVDDTLTIDTLTRDPYSVYRRFRAESPVIKVKSVGRMLITKAADTKAIKDNAELFSSDDPNTPMRKAFQANTLMRKDGSAHLRERNSMAAAFSPANIKNVWLPLYNEIADDYIGKLPKGEIVDLFAHLAAPISARCLAHIIGLTDASDADLCRWSQTLIDGAGNFGYRDEPFEKSDRTNEEVNRAIDATLDYNGHALRPNAISAMLHGEDPVDVDIIRSNIKIVIGGGINEPRDALCTALYGLLTNPDQRDTVLNDEKLWMPTIEETVRWVAPIQLSSRRAVEETEIRGVIIPKDEVLMTIQASANHDEELFEDPHLFNIFRKDNRHQAFGNGPHFCMGTHIARRMIADIVLPKLFERFPNMELKEAKDVVFWGFGFRGPLNLPVLLN